MDFLLNLAGGIALLLWGVRMVRTGLTRSFGAELRHVLAAASRNRIGAFAAGLGVTTLIQSSTATALIVSSFAARGMVTGAAALAIMLGADVGTTITVQILALGLDWLSPLLITAGVIGFLATSTSRPRGIARAAIGLGLALLALHLITAASDPLRQSAVVSLVLEHLSDQPLIAVLIAALLTWLSHSSVAIVLLVMSLAAAQVVNVELALALVLGVNLGGAVVPVVISAGALPPARRVPVGNLIMRTAGILVLLPFLVMLTPAVAALGDAPARMVVNFHTAFNLALGLLFLPFVRQIDALTRRLLPGAVEAAAPGQPRYLDDDALDTPTVALTCATREALRMGDQIRAMLAQTIDVFRRNDERLMREIEHTDDLIDRLHEAIKLYLTRLSREELDEVESARSVEILSFTTNLEHIGDIIDKNLMELAAKKIKSRASFSAAGLKELEAFHKHVLANMDLALHVFLSGDVDQARRLLKEKTAIRRLERTSMDKHFSRIGEGLPESIDSSSLHLDVLRDLKRINGHLTSVAYPILERAGELAETRLLSAPGQDAAGMTPSTTGKEFSAR